MKIVAVFHSDKVEGVTDLPAELGANPPMNLKGMAKIHGLVDTIRTLGPYAGMYVSRLARALDTASMIAMALDTDFVTVKGLGQHGNKDGDTVIMYPGCESESFDTWQKNAVKTIGTIEVCHGGYGDDSDVTVLIVSHRPVIGGLVAFAKGITDSAGIKAIVVDPATSAKGYVVFNIDAERKLTVIEG